MFLRSVTIPNKRQNEYYSELPFYKSLQSGLELKFNSPVTFFVGENGCGKSTLIEGLAVALGYNAEGGSKNFNFATRFTTSKLWEELEVGKTGYEQDGFFLRAESFYNVASNIDELKINLENYGGESLHNRSHGESFLSLVQNRFRGNGLYILDEPEAALSPTRQLTLLIEINRLVNSNSQFIIATHSPILMAYPGAECYCLDNGIELIDYKTTEHYTVTKSFLCDTERFLGNLLK